MPRRQLVEIHDQTWCPRLLGHSVRSVLQLSAEIMQMYSCILPQLLEATKDEQQVIDLCSGAGGPWLGLVKALPKDSSLRIRLTDLFPNRAAFRQALKATQGVIGFEPESVDATDVPASLTGFRTLFASFHHFEPAMARSILQDAVDKHEGIGIFEMTERTPLGIGFVALTSPLGPLVLTPLIRPFSWARLFWTYIIPVLPLMAMFDGVVSCIRTYSPAELQQLVESLDADNYEWQIGKVRAPFNPMRVTYLIGRPRKVATEIRAAS